MTDTPVPLAEQIAAVREVVVRYGLADHDQPDHLYFAMRAILATLEQHERAMAVVAAARRFRDSLPVEELDAEAALHESVDAFDAAQETDRE